MPNFVPWFSFANTKVAMPEATVRVKRRGASLPRHPAALDDGVAVGELHQALDVLVDHQDGLPRAAQALEAFPDLLAHQRRESFSGFIQDQEMGIRDQGAADGEHLLLAAGELVA